MENLSVDQELDACGLSCPMPLLKAKQMLNAMKVGEVLMEHATDPGSRRDFASFAELAGHGLLLSDEQSGIFTFVLRKHG